MHQLNIRLSYHDMKMFQQILESIPKQREVARKPSIAREKKQPANFQGLCYLYFNELCISFAHVEGNFSCENLGILKLHLSINYMSVFFINH